MKFVCLLILCSVWLIGADNCYICRNAWSPICGSDDNTYANECFMYCKNNGSSSDLTIAYDGPCGGYPDDCDKKCNNEYFPACGSDHIAYNNICIFNCAALIRDITFVRWGRYC